MVRTAWSKYDFVGNREKFREYERLPFFLPETTQQDFYSEAFTELLVPKHQATTLWNNVKDLRFQDGRIPGFMTDPVRGVCAATRQAITGVRNTIDKLKYDMDDLDIRNVVMEPHTVGQLFEPKPDTAKTTTQLSHLAHMTRYQVIKMV